MFYTYGIPFERASSLSFTKTLPTALAEAAHVAAHNNPLTETLGAVSPQFIGPYFTTTSTPSAWSVDFSTAFAAAPTPPIGYIGITVGKFALAVSAGVAHATPLKFTSHFPAFSVASANAAAIVRRVALNRIFPVLASNIASLTLPRLNHAVVAAKQAALSNVRRLTSKFLIVQGGVFSAAFSTEFAAFGQANVAAAIRNPGQAGTRTTSPQSVSLSRAPGLLRSIAASSLAVLLRTPGRLLAAVEPSAVGTLAKRAGRLLAALSASGAAIVRGLPVHVAALSTNVAHYSSGGGNFFSRALSALSPGAVLVQRGLTTQRGTTSPNVARVLKGAGKIQAVASASVAALVRTTARLLAGLSPNTASIQRTAALPRSIVSPTVVALRTAGAHIGTVLSAAQPQASTLLKLLTHSVLLALARAQSSAASISAVLSYLRALGATTAQSSVAAKGITRSLASVSTATQALARQTQRVLSAASAAAAAMRTLAVRSLSLGVASPTPSVILRAAHVRVINAVMAQSAAMTRLHGAALSVLSASALSLRRSMSKAVALLIPGLPALVRTIAKAFVVQTPAALSLIRSFVRGFAVASAEATAAVTRFGSTTGGVASSSAASVRRLTGKLAQAFLQQLASAGRIDAVSVHATSANVASALQPKSNVLRAAQLQVARVVSWFRIFVPDWAFQQTTLLPPGGGPAEPPSFGPIDPQDQTIFAFDWSSRADINDPIVSAAVVSVPPGLIFAPSPVFVTGTLVTVTVAPFSPPQLPATYSLRCTAVFASGRRSSFSIPVPVRTL